MQNSDSRSVVLRNKVVASNMFMQEYPLTMLFESQLIFFQVPLILHPGAVAFNMKNQMENVIINNSVFVQKGIQATNLATNGTTTLVNTSFPLNLRTFSLPQSASIEIDFLLCCLPVNHDSLWR